MGSVGQYTQGWFPWVGSKSNVGTITRSNLSTVLGMGYAYLGAGEQNNEITWDTYLDSVTWKICQLHFSDTVRGIYTYYFDATSVGTIDGYNATDIVNRYSEITGVAVATAGVKTVKVKMESKNASSTNYYYTAMSHALIRTGGTASTPAGTDTPGYTWEHIWWMGVKGSTGTHTRNQHQIYLSGGYGYPGVSTNPNEMNTDAWVDAGTFKAVVIYHSDVSAGITKLQLDGSTIASADAYATSGVPNVVSETTGIVIASAGVKNVKHHCDTKNASATNFAQFIHSTKLLRTGA